MESSKCHVKVPELWCGVNENADRLWDLRTSLGGGRLRKPHSKSFNTYGNNNISGAYFNKFGNQISKRIASFNLQF
jgi:hypothetical protein